MIEHLSKLIERITDMYRKPIEPLSNKYTTSVDYPPCSKHLWNIDRTSLEQIWIIHRAPKIYRASNITKRSSIYRTTIGHPTSTDHRSIFECFAEIRWHHFFTTGCPLSHPPPSQQVPTKIMRRYWTRLALSSTRSTKKEIKHER